MNAEKGQANIGTGDVLMEIEDLQMHFPITEGIIFQRKVGAVKAVDGVSFNIRKGETLGLVGESGCGKSTIGRTIMRLIQPTEGAIKVDGQDIARLSRRQMQPYRRRMQIIFQDPYS